MWATISSDIEPVKDYSIAFIQEKRVTWVRIAKERSNGSGGDGCASSTVYEGGRSERVVVMVRYLSTTLQRFEMVKERRTSIPDARTRSSRVRKDPLEGNPYRWQQQARYFASESKACERKDDNTTTTTTTTTTMTTTRSVGVGAHRKIRFSRSLRCVVPGRSRTRVLSEDEISVLVVVVIVVVVVVVEIQEVIAPIPKIVRTK
ncbi:hypothetical protein HZH66_005018 [Vespula vulgaris]|uniref:Uncharacterized protein n=1 Tax=Vespula vulgaris TaxID=7454 RepID=A0A834KF25_VESVU|nr:hypothetical protein HZH66_005018 [Vespula vulgaris]